MLIGIFILMQTEVSAAWEIEPDHYKPGSVSNVFEEGDTALKIGNTIITSIRVIGIVVTVVMLIVLGIKYMTGSVEEKADYKKSMIPYLIGAFIFFAISQILAVIIQLVSTLNK